MGRVIGFLDVIKKDMKTEKADTEAEMKARKAEADTWLTEINDMIKDLKTDKDKKVTKITKLKSEITAAEAKVEAHKQAFSSFKTAWAKESPACEELASNFLAVEANRNLERKGLVEGKALLKGKGQSWADADRKVVG